MATIDYSRYSGSDSYSDGDIENVVTAHINAGDPSAALEYDTRWACFYHLSPIRENILNWYPFKPGASVLEIGGGFGAVTGALCDKCARVTSVELSKRRAEGLFARHKDRDNLKVIVGNLNDIEFDEKFDYITLIGVLEYACAFTDAPDPFTAFLRKLRGLLKPDGRLLIAIENRFGLKYWCGAEEDHTGNAMDGIDGYEGVTHARTFGKAELTELLGGAGFTSANYYYPYPDYKLPNVIYTDRFQPSSDAAGAVREFYLNNEYFTANERRILPDIAANGVFPFFSNSFFVEAGTALPDNETLYAVLSTDRKAKYSVGTVIGADGRVAKFPTRPQAAEHIAALDSNHACLKARGVGVIAQEYDGTRCVSPYIDAPTADKYAAGLLAKGDAEGVRALFRKLADAIEKASPAAEAADGSRRAEKVFLDMNLSNSFLIDGELRFFDQEWVAENADPRFALYRALTHFFSKAPESPLFAELLDEYGFDAAAQAEFARADADFLREVNDAGTVDYLNSHTYSYDKKIGAVLNELRARNAALEECVKKQEAALAASAQAPKESFSARCKRKLRNGLRRCVPFRVRAFFKRVFGRSEESRYDKWLRVHAPSPEHVDGDVKFSVLVPLYNTDKKLLREMIESVLAQTYPNFELCLADASDEKHSYVASVAEEYARKDARVKFRRLEENKGISGNTNECRKLATGDYLALLDHDDLLAPHALASNYKVIKAQAPDVLYSDEDKIDPNGKRHLPFFKPDYDRDLLYSQMYICHFLVFKAELFDKVGGLSDRHSGAQDYDLMLRFTEHTENIAHISDMLYSWRETPSSTSVNPDSKPYAHDAGKTALDAHLKRRYGEYAHAEDSEYLFVYDARFDLLKNAPLVSIIIPTKNGADYVRRCVTSILETSSWKNYEILILDNNSDDPAAFACFDELQKRDGRVRVIRAEFPFNWSKVNNFGARHAKGDVYIFLNNDTCVITPDWIERLAENALRRDVGIVGGLLLYEDGTIQHAGVVVGMNHWADHVFKAMPTEHYGHGFVSPMISRDVLAVTGACMAVSRETFRKLGGFNEDFIVCGSDVEICVKAYKAGLSVLYDANVRLTHYESKTRDANDIPKIDFLLSDRVYEEFRGGRDPFYNRNLDINSTSPRAAV